MAEMKIQQQFVVNGKVFTSQSDAMDYMNSETIGKFLLEREYSQEFVNFIIENLKFIKGVYADLKSRKVTRSEKAQLKKELDFIIKEGIDVPFIRENFQNILDSFRWPVVRLTDEEKEQQMRDSFAEITDDTDVIEALIEKKDELLEAFNSYKPKRELPPALRERLEAMKAAKANKA